MNQLSLSELSYEREFQYGILESAIFGAFFSAIQSRKETDNLTQTELARLTGKDKTAISKLIGQPRNWTLRTISDLCVALELDFEFNLRDQTNTVRTFTAFGQNIEGDPKTLNVWFLDRMEIPSARRRASFPVIEGEYKNLSTPRDSTVRTHIPITPSIAGNYVTQSAVALRWRAE